MKFKVMILNLKLKQISLLKNQTEGNPIIPNIYRSRVEVNHVEEQRSTEMEISYNNNLRKAFIEMKRDNSATKLIYNFDTDEIYSIKCKKF